MWATVRGLAVLRPAQFPMGAPGKAMEEGSSAHVPCIHLGDTGEAPGSRLAQPQICHHWCSEPTDGISSFLSLPHL